MGHIRHTPRVRAIRVEPKRKSARLQGWGYLVKSRRP
jgi:hypothetical protein